MVAKEAETRENQEQKLDQEIEIEKEEPEIAEEPAELEPEAEEWKNRFIRLQADFDNHRKRANKERLEERERGEEGVLLQLLEVCDNFSRAISAAEDSTDYDGLLKGVKMIESQLKGVLTRFFVEPIPALNQPFDPHLHHAVLHTEAADVPANTIIAELQVGYQRKGKVLRPSMVQVSQNSAKTQGGQDSDE